MTVARKPLEGTAAANCLKWGTGGLDLDSCRIPVGEGEVVTIPTTGRILSDKCSTRFTGNLTVEDAVSGAIKMRDMGRFPANMILTLGVELPEHYERCFYRTGGYT